MTPEDRIELEARIRDVQDAVALYELSRRKKQKGRVTLYHLRLKCRNLAQFIYSREVKK